MIPNSVPPVTGKEIEYITQVINGGTLSDGGGHFSQRCQSWLEEQLNCPRVFLTPSGTAALELAALALEIQPGDEVIVPSYTYISTANAFLLRGASLVYVDIDPETMNIDVTKVREAISPKTRAIVPVHYAGVPCDMDAIIEAIGDRKDIYIVEDAAQGLFSSYKDGRALGTIGAIGCISFHTTKNVTSGGAGGAILINDQSLINRVETIRDKGTTRPQFLRGEIDHYTWQRAGVSCILSEMQAAYLWGQLEASDQIQAHRHRIWDFYQQNLAGLREKGVGVPRAECISGQHNAHIFFIKVRDGDERRRFTSAMREKGVAVLAHYGPLHRTPPALEARHVLHPEDYATRESQRLVRLPLFYAMTMEQAEYVTRQVQDFFCRNE